MCTFRFGTLSEQYRSLLARQTRSVNIAVRFFIYFMNQLNLIKIRNSTRSPGFNILRKTYQKSGMFKEKGLFNFILQIGIIVFQFKINTFIIAKKSLFNFIMIYILLIENNFFFLSVGDMKKKMYLSMTFLVSLTISNILLLNNKKYLLRPMKSCLKIN